MESTALLVGEKGLYPKALLIAFVGFSLGFEIRHQIKWLLVRFIPPHNQAHWAVLFVSEQNVFIDPTLARTNVVAQGTAVGFLALHKDAGRLGGAADIVPIILIDFPDYLHV